MEKVTIAIKTVHAAFDDEPGVEIARILRSLADRFALDGVADGTKFYDANGNCCGRVAIDGGR